MIWIVCPAVRIFVALDAGKNKSIRKSLWVFLVFYLTTVSNASKYKCLYVKSLRTKAYASTHPE